MTATTHAEVIDLIRRGKRAKSRAAASKKIVTGLATYAVAGLSGGFELMLAVGIAHAEWIHVLPTIGYWWAVLLVLLLRGTFSTIRPTSKGEA